MSNAIIDDELSTAHLEPGCDENPLEAELEYNPIRYCYEITADTEAGPAQVSVRFALQEHKDLDTIEFTDWPVGSIAKKDDDRTNGKSVV